MFSRFFRGALILAALALAGCGSDATCASSCDKVRACMLSTSGISCNASCTGAEQSCAQCLEDKSCADIRAGACASACPTYRP